MVVFTKETSLEIPASVLENHIKITIIVKIFLFVAQSRYRDKCGRRTKMPSIFLLEEEAVSCRMLSL